MSGHQLPTSQQAKRQKAAGGCRVKVYLHAVTDEQATLLTDSGSICPLEEISKKTGVDVEFDPHQSPVPGMKILIIRGVPSQIEEVVRLIRQMTGAQVCPDDIPRDSCIVNKQPSSSVPIKPFYHQYYEKRFCGPATTLSVPCTCPPRVSVKTLGQAVWCTGECYTAVITLLPEQLHLLNTAPTRLFVTGPPGTGKTVVLLLMAIQWLRCGHHVYIVSTCSESRAACIMLYHLLLQTVNTQQSAGVSPGQPHLLLPHLGEEKDVKKAVNDLSQLRVGGSLYVIADEVMSDYSPRYRNTYFQTLCDKLLTQIPRLHLWAASCYHGYAPGGWHVEYFTRPLRSPPAVVMEVEQDEMITTDHHVQPYSERGVSDHTDGPPVRRLHHRGQGHSGRWAGDCVTCGREVASFLHSLRVGVTESGTTTSTTVTSTSGGTTSSITVTRISGGTPPPCLQWRDMFVLYWGDIRDNSGMVKGLEEAGIPVRVMKNKDIEDVATARSDVVWVAGGRRVRGLERKVVVCLEDPHVDLIRSGVSERDRSELISFYNRISTHLDLMSRCTSQLVVVSPDPSSPEGD